MKKKADEWKNAFLLFFHCIKMRYIIAQNPIQIRSQILIRDRALFPIIAMIRKAGSRTWNNNAIWKLKMPPHSVCCSAPGSRIEKPGWNMILIFLLKIL